MVVFAKSNRLSGQGDRDSNVVDEADEFREIGVRMALGARVRAAIALKPSTLLRFHRSLVQRKYRMLFSPEHRAKPGQQAQTRL